jgi:tetratricopeptide (TPR) repeat protein
MGEVYRARHVKLGREAAVKVLPVDLASDPERRRRFEREARAASALNHPNIVTIYDIDEHDGVHSIAMELVEGGTLRELLRDGPLPVGRLLALARQIAEGLARAHSEGIVHQDLNPENIYSDRRRARQDPGLRSRQARPAGRGPGSLRRDHGGGADSSRRGPRAPAGSCSGRPGAFSPFGLAWVSLPSLRQLWRSRAPGPAALGIRAVAVLPLQNLSGNPDQENFADGMTEALITDLAKVGALNVETEPTLAEAHAMLGFVRFRADWDWDDAERSLKRAIDLNPATAAADHFLGLLLGALGRFEEALTAVRRAEELDQHSPSIGIEVGRVLHFARRYDEVIGQLTRVCALEPGFPGGHADLGLALFPASGPWARRRAASARQARPLAHFAPGDRAPHQGALEILSIAEEPAENESPETGGETLPLIQ